MPGGRMPICPASASEGFSSTPVKPIPEQKTRSANNVDNGVLSDDDDTFSLLSPIYHDSFDSDSDEELQPSLAQGTSPRQSDYSELSISPLRCELPRTLSEQIENVTVEPAGTPPLSAWEMWLVNKAKEDRFKLLKKAEEERILKEKAEQQQREQEGKRIVIEEKIGGWLKMKREQEKHKQLLKQSKEEEELQRQQEKQRETEQKAQQKFKNWLQKKNQEKVEMEKKEKEEAAQREEQEMERRRKAEKKFKEWLSKANEKSKSSPKSPCHPTNPYDNSYPSPSFYNPIPWKPIHVPSPETSQNKTFDKKPQRQRKRQSSHSSTFGLRNPSSAGLLLQRR